MRREVLFHMVSYMSILVSSPSSSAVLTVLPPLYLPFHSRRSDNPKTHYGGWVGVINLSRCHLNLWAVPHHYKAKNWLSLDIKFIFVLFHVLFTYLLTSTSHTHCLGPNYVTSNLNHLVAATLSLCRTFFFL